MIILSCGHTVHEFGDSIYVEIESESLDMELGYVPSICCMTVCNACFVDYVAQGVVLYSRAEDY